MQDNVKHLSFIMKRLRINGYDSAVKEEIAKLKGIDTGELTSLLSAGENEQAAQLAKALWQDALSERAASFASSKGCGI